jgi:hypothetical protein
MPTRLSPRMGARPICGTPSASDSP